MLPGDGLRIYVILSYHSDVEAGMGWQSSLSSSSWRRGGGAATESMMMIMMSLLELSLAMAIINGRSNAAVDRRRIPTIMMIMAEMGGTTR